MIGRSFVQAVSFLFFFLLFLPGCGRVVSGVSSSNTIGLKVDWGPGLFFTTHPDTAGKTARKAIVYELQLVNFYPDMHLAVSAVEVRSGGPSGELLLKLEKDELKNCLWNPYSTNRYSIRPWPMVYVWISLYPESRIPDALHHRVRFVSDKGVERVVEGRLVPVNDGLPIVLGPPVRGGRWWAWHAPSNLLDNHHRHGLFNVDGLLMCHPERSLLLRGNAGCGGRCHRGGRPGRPSGKHPFPCSGAQFGNALRQLRNAGPGKWRLCPLCPPENRNTEGLCRAESQPGTDPWASWKLGELGLSASAFPGQR
jgi:hypothetical protein